MIGGQIVMVVENKETVGAAVDHMVGTEETGEGTTAAEGTRGGVCV